MDILAQGRKRELFRCRRETYRIAERKVVVAACSVCVHLLSSWLDSIVNAVEEIKDQSLALRDAPRAVQLQCINSLQPSVRYSISSGLPRVPQTRLPLMRQADASPVPAPMQTIADGLLHSCLSTVLHWTSRGSSALAAPCSQVDP
ncbi:hypothetical protein HETIRDRAFT_104621 [Heterobasidion irregulare TC 32-1]|uniref:Uncharacterized protein n=1 Tax=Heterobasidion irregulare (strain TC 32-1) TaxID=747525 RepID=W4K0Z1_HETIT|nr:uncharacterized protein HETIRDRAFT_104621 [Heterobasidion irregulare TC 32-1]ETW79374.1 hypothetical protein HETIRDRAFT_104621 [Heterobasidion irregulare TC 32-1]